MKLDYVERVFDLDGRTGGWADRRTDGRTNAQTNRLLKQQLPYTLNILFEPGTDDFFRPTEAGDVGGIEEVPAQLNITIE